MFIFVMMNEMSLEEKLENIMAIFSIDEDHEMSYRQVVQVLITIETYMDSRQKILEIEHSLIEKVEGGPKYLRKDLIDAICTQPCFNGLQSFLLVFTSILF